VQSAQRVIATAGVCGHRDHDRRRPIHAALYDSRLDKTVANGSKFATIQEVRAHLEEIAKLPLWRRDLVNKSAIVFDPAELEITDPTTAESFSFRGRGPGVAQLAASGQGQALRRV